ncbi:hypothetical protein DMC30DRAFT_260810 [Rhodotorula diobovata]|uniref:Uncharacterized protein n=1 Tax=Rhodotorula diobovata TaxID=5288 RepID=A0A5C5G456_9BASI|nr:hypothetical protein DMC30DRAFT_260810 [Rhodotorula diobovata]
MDGFPDLRQQPASPLTHSASSVEDLVVVPEQQGPFPSSSSTSPLAAPLHVSAHDMVTVNPSYTAPNAFGVSFPGTANFAALPFPPAEHPLPPPGSLPARGVGPPAVACSPPLVPPPRPYVENKPVPPAPAPVPQQQPRPVPPPVEQPQYSLKAHAPPGPLPSAPPPLPNSMPSPPSQAQSQSPFVLFGPFPVPTQGPWQPQGMPSPYAAYGPPQGMHGGPTLTPWPPVPLRHIDSFLGGAYAPGPSYPPLPPQPQTPTTPTPTPQGQSFSGHRRESSSVASATTGPLEYPISSARSAAAHAAAQATQAARVEQARMGANYAHQQQQGGESGSPTSPFQSDLGSFSMSSMTGWSYPTPQQVHDAQQAHAAAQQAHQMQQQHQQHQHQHAQQQTPSPPHAHSTSPSSESDTQAAHAPSHDVCAVHGCACTVFCELSPCGCRLCRDHLGWVMRGAVTVEVDAGHEGDGGKDARSAKAATKRVFRCVACHVESSMAGPAHRASLAASSSSRRGSEHVVGLGLTGVEVPGEDDQAHAFSIKYFSSGPAPFAHRSPSPTSTIGGNGNGKNHDVDLSTALDPAGDASLVQHLPVPPPAIELQPASPTAQRSFATRGAATGAPPHLVPLDIEAAHRARPGAVEGAQPFLYQIEGPQSTSPGVLTPTERGSSGSSEHVAAAIEAVRPSSALPALEGNAAVPTLGDDDGRKRSLSRSATSSAAMYEPNPLEAALGAQAQAHAHGPAPARRQVPSPPESPASLLPVRTEGGPLPASMTTEGQSLVPSPPPPPQQHQQHAVQLQPDFTFPPQPPQPPPPHRAMRSFTHSGMLTVPYGTLPPMAYASFPPGSVSVQPHAQAHYQHVPPGAFHAQGLALQPVFASPLGGGGVTATGKKRGSLPPALLGPMAAGAGGLPRWIERMPGASGGGATGAGGGSGGGGAGQGGRGGISGSATFPPRQPPALDPMSDGARLERGGFPIVKVENVRSWPLCLLKEVAHGLSETPPARRSRSTRASRTWRIGSPRATSPRRTSASSRFISSCTARRVARSRTATSRLSTSTARPSSSSAWTAPSSATAPSASSGSAQVSSCATSFRRTPTSRWGRRGRAGRRRWRLRRPPRRCRTSRPRGSASPTCSSPWPTLAVSSPSRPSRSSSARGRSSAASTTSRRSSTSSLGRGRTCGTRRCAMRCSTRLCVRRDSPF